MAQRRIGLNLVTLRNGRDADLVTETLDRVRRAGFHAVGPWAETLQGWRESGRSMADLAREIEGRGLKADEICAAGVLEPDGAVARPRELFEWAAELGVPAVISIYGQPSNPLDKVRDDWAEFVRGVEDIGVSPAFEFIGPWPQYNSPLQAWEVIRTGPALGKMVFDTFHFWRGGCDLTEIGRFPGERVALVHLNDVKDVPRETARDTDRTYPGEGVIPLGETLSGLIESGFAGPFSVEIFGEVQGQDPDEVAARAFEAADRVVRAL